MLSTGWTDSVRGAESSIVITASRSLTQQSAPASVSSETIKPEQQANIASSLVDIAASAPGVTKSGKGGLFQSLAIRGISGQRILHLVEGIPIFTDRRAGSTSSFIDPELIQAIDLVKGPVSTWYGSGALGGVVQSFVKTDQRAVNYSHSSAGNQQVMSALYSTQDSTDSTLDAGVVQRQADNADNVQADELNTQFKQTSAYLKHATRLGEYQLSSFAAASKGTDIGKSELDYPDNRITNYPLEQHLMARVAIELPQQWQLAVFAHDNELQTKAIKPSNSQSRVINKAFDYGLSWLQALPMTASLKEQLQHQWGIDWLRRTDVSAIERNQTLDVNQMLIAGSLSENRSLDNGTLDERAIYYALSSIANEQQLIDNLSWQLGMRYTEQRSDAASQSSVKDNAINGFIGASLKLTDEVALKASVGNGLRFASLSERFYTGTTGRGQVIGNPDLTAERSVATELALVGSFEQWHWQLELHNQRVDNYIERYNLANDTRTYRNLDEANIQGVDAKVSWYLTDAELSLQYSYLSGENASGQPLADIPANRYRFTWQQFFNDWRLQTNLEYRLADDELGAGEKTTAEVLLIDTAASYQFDDNWQFQLKASNLLNEAYFPSADEDIPLALGREFEFTIRYQW